MIFHFWEGRPVVGISHRTGVFGDVETFPHLPYDGKKGKESITSKTTITDTLGPDERHAQRFSEIVMDIYWDTQYAFASTSANSEYIFVHNL